MLELREDEVIQFVIKKIFEIINRTLLRDLNQFYFYKAKNLNQYLQTEMKFIDKNSSNTEQILQNE